MNSKKNLKVTSAREWASPAREGVLVELPSGAVARLRPVSVNLFARLGKIPDSLTRSIVEVTDEVTNDKVLRYQPHEGESESQFKANRLRENTLFGDAVIYAAFLEPKVVESNPGEDEISIEQIAPEDRNYVIDLYNRPVSELKSFRSEQTANVEPVPATTDDGNQSE